MSDRGLYHVFRMPNLQELILCNNQQMSPETLQQLVNATQLCTLQLSFPPKQITSDSLTVLSHLTKLTSLKLEGTWLSPTHCKTILNNLHSLKKLTLTENIHLTPKTLDDIQFHSLEELIVDGVNILPKNTKNSQSSVTNNIHSSQSEIWINNSSTLYI
jgi:hypothetical protein